MQHSAAICQLTHARMARIGHFLLSRRSTPASSDGPCRPLLAMASSVSSVMGGLL